MEKIEKIIWEWYNNQYNDKDDEFFEKKIIDDADIDELIENIKELYEELKDDDTRRK